MMKQSKTDVIAIDTSRPSPTIVEYAASLLRQGELVIFPTETVYGLGADIFQPEALRQIFVVKERPLSDPLIVHIATLEALQGLTTSLPETVWKLAWTFWPGPLTVILPRSLSVPSIVAAGRETIAIRMPRHPVARALIEALGSPIAAPSANRFKHISPTTAQHALADLQGRIPLILDGGPCDIGIESTILDLCTDEPTILRPGGISLEALRAVLPEIRLATSHQSQLSEEQPQKAPGQLSTHYAPTIPLLLYDGSEKAMRAAIFNEACLRTARGERVGILVADGDLPDLQESNAVVYALGDAENPSQIASALFTGLRMLEDAQVQVILCRNFSERDLGLAIRDRLGRAAGGSIISV